MNKRGRGIAAGSADLYSHFKRRNDLPKSDNYYHVVCVHCTRAYIGTDLGCNVHPSTGKRVAEPKTMKNVISAMTKHVETCEYAQGFIQAEAHAEASGQPALKFQCKVAAGPMDAHAKPLLHAPLLDEKEHEWQLKLLHMTVAHGLPFSWIETAEAVAVFAAVRHVRLKSEIPLDIL